MRKTTLPLFLFLATLLLPIAGRATHIFGADFFYQYVSGNSYKVTLVIYGDCSGSSFPTLPGTPEIEIYDYNSQLLHMNITTNDTGVEVTPVCPSQINNTTCKGGSVPGVKKFTYSTIVNIPHQSAGWRFVFTGNMGPTSGGAGRSNSITNVLIGQGSVMVLEATLNNTTGPNSSPQFTTIPTPFYCVNVQQEYNQGAVDPDNDNLTYSLASALEQGGPVSYAPGYSATNPLLTTNNFSFSTVTGQMTFVPAAVQKSTVVNKVEEFRNGVLVGSAMREMTFIVLGNCNNNPPAGTADTVASSIAGVVPDGLNFFNICQGTTNAHFQIKPTDPDNDTIQVSLNGLPAGAVATVTGNNTKTPVINFSWNTTNVAPGIYTFYVTYKDQGCPIASQQTQAYTVRVVRPNEMTATVRIPTQCVRKAVLQYTFAYGLLPRTVVVRQGTTVIRTFTDTASVVPDSLAPGTYTYTITSPKLSCPTVYTLNVVDSGQYPISPVSPPDQFYCLGDPAAVLTATPTAGAVINWYDASGNLLPAPPVPNTANPGIYTWLVSQRYLVCESPKDTVKVYVTRRPVAGISAPPFLCTNDTARISFNGTVGVGPIINYQWGWGDATYKNGQGGGPWDVHWSTSGLKTITLQVFENQCPSDPVSVQVLVKESPVAAFGPVKNICIYDTLELAYTAIALGVQTFSWSFGDAPPGTSTGTGPFRLNWATPGVKHLVLRVENDGCSDTLMADLTVHPAPVADIENPPGRVCLGDKIYLKASGGVRYSWTPKDKIYQEPDGTLFTRVMVPTTYTVSAINEFNCVDSDAVTFNDIEPCCKFSYPTAFTPNGDGRNDKWRVILYGNEEHFSLSIYDRWGQRLWHSADPKEGWDGTYNGKPCEMGTYFYYVQGKCLTGYEEAHKGEVTLIR